MHVGRARSTSLLTRIRICSKIGHKISPGACKCVQVRASACGCICSAYMRAHACVIWCALAHQSDLSAFQGEGGPQPPSVPRVWGLGNCSFVALTSFFPLSSDLRISTKCQKMENSLAMTGWQRAQSRIAWSLPLAPFPPPSLLPPTPTDLPPLMTLN